MEPQDPTPQILKVPRDGYDLHAQIQAPLVSEAPWVVFSNSLITDLSIWDHQVEHLKGRYGILRYDQAGHGASGIPENPLDFDVLGQDLIAVMDAAKVGKAAYVGLSMGVPTGLAAYKIAPTRFTSLIFSDGQAKTAPGGAAGWADRIAAAKASGMQAYASLTADRWLTKTARPEQRARLTQMIADTEFAGFSCCATALMNYNYEDQLAQISCPTLLIAGAQDGAMPVGMETKLKPAISGAQMHVINNAGHVPCFEQPEKFTAQLSRFLDETYGVTRA